MSLLAAALLAAGPAIANPVIAGQEESGFPSVVSLGIEMGDEAYSMCSGNLITPRIVLTAAHCGEGVPESMITSAGRAFFGADINDYEHAVGFVAYRGHPDYQELSGWDLGQNDVGIGILNEDAPVSPSPVSWRELTLDDIGRPVKSVGFGISNASTGTGSGIKRSADLTLDQLEEQFMVSYATEEGTTICSGDSGGPQFIDVDGVWVQAAVHSWADADCVHYSGSTRTDLVREWVLSEVEAVHGSTDLCWINDWYNDGTCDTHCDLPDPDCSADTGLESPGGCACSAGGRAARGGALGALLLGLGLLVRRRE
jgi:MYXO-CTERM domain-containing protein